MFKKLLILFLTVSLLFTPSISFATEVMTRYYTKTIGALDSYTKLLIHGDSIGDATGKTVTANGNAAVTTAQHKFAELGRSISFDGTGDYLSLADSDDWWFDNQDFTIECWFRTSNSSARQGILCQRIDDNNLWRLEYDGGTPQLYFDVYSGGTEIILISSGSWQAAVDTWYQCVVARSGNIYYLFINGNLLATSTYSLAQNNIGSVLYIGASYRPTGTIDYFNGYLGELRISKGIARWTSHFTPPTAPYDGARTVVNITGLDGNTDEEYRLIVRHIGNSPIGANLFLRPNNDSTNGNYGYQTVNGANTPAGANRATASGFNISSASQGGSSTNEITFIESLIYAKSGYIRTCLNSVMGKVSGTTVTVSELSGQSWNNTTDNIISFVLAVDQTNGLGVGTQIDLYKKASKQ